MRTTHLRQPHTPTRASAHVRDREVDTTPLLGFFSSATLLGIVLRNFVGVVVEGPVWRQKVQAGSFEPASDRESRVTFEVDSSSCQLAHLSGVPVTAVSGAELHISLLRVCTTTVLATTSTTTAPPQPCCALPRLFRHVGVPARSWQE